MTNVQEVWNFTIDATSPVFHYEPYSEGTSLTNGWQAGYSISGFNTQPGEMGNGDSYHMTSLNGATVTLSFFGTGVTLFGQANCSYDILLDGSLAAVHSLPSNVLFNEFGLKNANHNITLVAQPGTSNQSLTYSGAQVTAPNSGDGPSAIRIDNQNTSVITYEGSWLTKTDHQVPSAQNPSPFFITSSSGAYAELNFKGRAVEIRGMSNWGWWTYTVILDGNSFAFNASSWWIVPDALLFYQDGLDEDISHTLKIVNSAGNGFNFELNSVTLYQSSNSSLSSSPSNTSTTSSATSSSLASTSSSSSSSSSALSAQHHKLVAGTIAGVIIGVVACIALITLSIFWCYRRRKLPSSTNDALLSPYPSSDAQSSMRDIKLSIPPSHNVPPSNNIPPSHSTPPTHGFSSIWPPSSAAVSNHDQHTTRGPIMFRDSLFAGTSSGIEDLASFPRSPTMPSEYTPNLGRSSLRTSTMPRPAWRDHKGHPPLEPIYAVSNSASGSTWQSESAVVERLVDAVSERLAHRFGSTSTDVQTPPPVYTHS